MVSLLTFYFPLISLRKEHAENQTGKVNLESLGLARIIIIEGFLAYENRPVVISYYIIQ